MNRNVESHFALNPTSIDIGRSTFDRSHTIKTSFNVGDIIPFYVDEVLPGDTFNVRTSKVVRMQTLLTPIMDNIYLDTYFFFVPNRLVWSHWKEFNGENTQSAWLPKTEYEVPQLTSPAGGFAVGTIADYMGIPTSVPNLSVNALPFRAYALIMNEWFRDENLSDPLNIPVDNSLIGSNTYTAIFNGTPNGPTAIGFTTNGEQYGADGDQGTLRPALPVINNLWAVASGNAKAATINQLRLAFQIQKLYERDARGGTRYIEILKSHFGVTSPDARLQRPEYLGGNRIPININQIVQQSGTTPEGTPQGTPVGLSVTQDSNSDFIKSFVEHGFVIGVMVARYDHTYQQGLERFWSRRDRFDYYWPVFANIGEQAVKNKEIYAQGSKAVDGSGGVIDDQVFGYQEAWADYRYKPNRVSGEMRSSYAQSLDVWHLADDYSQLPSLSDSWIREDSSNVDRVLAVASNNANQLFADIYVQNRSTRPMPLYSIPGLIDHH